jgi:hypothetical protein
MRSTSFVVRVSIFGSRLSHSRWTCSGLSVIVTDPGSLLGAGWVDGSPCALAIAALPNSTEPTTAPPTTILDVRFMTLLSWIP